MENQTKSPAEYRTASLKIFAGKHTAEHQWLIDEVVQKMNQGEDELSISQSIVRSGATGENGVLQVARDIYWRNIFAVANEDVAAGKENSPAIERSKVQALALATFEISPSNIQWRLEKAGCSTALAQRLAYDPQVLDGIRKVNRRDLWIGGGGLVLGLVGLIFFYNSEKPDIMPIVLVSIGAFITLRSIVRLAVSGTARVRKESSNRDGVAR